MTKKKQILAAAILSICSSAAFSGDPPAAPSPLYDDGPASPFLNKTDVTIPEIKAFALMEAVMQTAEGLIHAKGCSAMANKNAAGVPQPYGLHVFADEDAAVDNTATVTGPGSTYKLKATTTGLAGYGDKVTVNQEPMGADGFIKTYRIRGFDGLYSFNSKRNMMVGDSFFNVQGARGSDDLYTGKVIKDFYRFENKDTTKLAYYIILDWGLQSVSKKGYPNSKYWQRSKTSRSDGMLGKTVWVKDRLVGGSKCRITIDLNGDNYPEFFDQSGTLLIEGDKLPNAPVPAFGLPPFV